MLRLSLLLIGFVGWLLASPGPVSSLKIEYFYQNMFLSNAAEVVFEFKLIGCDATTKAKVTVKFGDSSAEQTIERVNCERWRVPHTYYSQPTGEAVLTIEGGESKPAPVDLRGPPETAPRPLTYQGGGPGSGGSSPKSGGQPPAETKTFQLILKNSGQGISGYVAVLGSPDSGFNVQNVKVTPVFLTNGFLFDGPGACSKAASGKCFSFRAELGDPEGCKNLQNKVMAEITVTGGARLVLDSMPTAVDAGPRCYDWVSDNKPINDISGNFELKQKTQ